MLLKPGLKSLFSQTYLGQLLLAWSIFMHVGCMGDSISVGRRKESPGDFTCYVHKGKHRGPREVYLLSEIVSAEDPIYTL